MQRGGGGKKAGEGEKRGVATSAGEEGRGEEEKHDSTLWKVLVLC